MTQVYDRYKVWLPWHWGPMIVYLAIIYTGAAVFFLERKTKVALETLTGRREPWEAWFPRKARVGSQTPRLAGSHLGALKVARPTASRRTRYVTIMATACERYFERYKVWLPWHWGPMVAYFAIIYTGAAVFFLERKAKAVLGGARRTGDSHRVWAPTYATRRAARRPTEVVEVFASTREAGSPGREELEEAAEIQEARVRVRR